MREVYSPAPTLRAPSPCEMGDAIPVLMLSVMAWHWGPLSAITWEMLRWPPGMWSRVLGIYLPGRREDGEITMLLHYNAHGKSILSSDSIRWYECAKKYWKQKLYGWKSVTLQYNLHQDLILGKKEIQKLFAWGIRQWFWQKHHKTWSLFKQIQKLGLPWFYLPLHAPECL